MWRRLRLLRTLSYRGRRELLLACAWQVRLRLMLLRDRGAIGHLASCAGRQRPMASAPLDSAEIERIVRWSAVICHASCLTTAFVHGIIAARHGLEHPVTIGVALDNGTFRAHAWAGTDERAGGFAPLWVDGRSKRP
jgi:Transglutaminase-like superfamily